MALGGVLGLRLELAEGGSGKPKNFQRPHLLGIEPVLLAGDFSRHPKPRIERETMPYALEFMSAQDDLAEEIQVSESRDYLSAMYSALDPETEAGYDDYVDPNECIYPQPLPTRWAKDDDTVDDAPF